LIGRPGYSLSGEAQGSEIAQAPLRSEKSEALSNAVTWGPGRGGYFADASLA